MFALTPSPNGPSQHQNPNPIRALLDSLTTTISDPEHPAQIAARTFALGLSLSLGPSILSFILVTCTRPSSVKARLRSLVYILKRELGITGFAFAITIAVGGGAALERIWQTLACPHPRAEMVTLLHPNERHGGRLDPKVSVYSQSKLAPYQKAFLANVVTSSLSVIILQRGRRRSHSTGRTPVLLSRRSPTFDLTLLFLVRSLDAFFQAYLFRRSTRESRFLSERTPSAVSPQHLAILGPDAGLSLSLADVDLKKEAARHEREAKEWHRRIATRVDAFAFWACSARIMWCFFYQPHRLPPTYVKWIMSLARVDRRLLDALRALRLGQWSYIHGSATQSNLLISLSEDLGLPATWGDPEVLPAFGGPGADVIWKALDVRNRRGIGGVPCELVHAGVGAQWGLGGSCIMNAAARAAYAFIEAIALYLPVHFIPMLLTRPRSILRLHRALPALLAAIRSATFLSAFLSSYWFSICLTRTLVLARLIPWVSHDAWDGPHGGVLAASLICGGSIWIENARRRGEMALYVLPRALRASLPDRWSKSGPRGIQIAEQTVFVLSLASLLTFARHRPESLRGLSRWTLAFVMKGPNAGFWKKRTMEVTTCPPTPATPLPTASQSPQYER
ncbi:hypothetical protein BV22DRAFT_1027730 [Leucogyrophana mollusca]|uniref:Uncharacterized protein n=1 Tax=Leucogyrophana mollusca TaxID=85980 RepID=A0ACB8C160_9AGAM|nr:hypothetical protein BV22DRAFT_1027730 [Leucogyrophana mollusca]